MAYEEVSRVEITEVTRQWQAGRGIREITRSTGLARNTIRKYLLTAQSCGLARDGPPPSESQLITLVQLNRAGPRQVAVRTNEVLEPRAEQIEQWLKQDKLKLTRIQELLAQRHCLVPYMSLRRFVIRKGWLGKSSQTTVRMADTEPGEVALTDDSAHGGYRARGSGRGGFRPLRADVGSAQWSPASGLGNGNRAGLFSPRVPVAAVWPAA